MAMSLEDLTTADLWKTMSAEERAAVRAEQRTFTKIRAIYERLGVSCPQAGQDLMEVESAEIECREAQLNQVAARLLRYLPQHRDVLALAFDFTVWHEQFSPREIPDSALEEEGID